MLFAWSVLTSALFVRPLSYQTGHGGLSGEWAPGTLALSSLAGPPGAAPSELESPCLMAGRGPPMCQVFLGTSLLW